MGVCFLATGCASSGSPDSSENKHLVFVCPIMENPYWQDCITGMQEAGSSLGADIEVIGPQTVDNFVEEMPPYMQQAIDSQPDGILVYAGVPAVAELIAPAVDDGIPVMTVDADAPETKRLAYVGTDLYGMGYSCGEELVALTDGVANVGYLCTSSDMENEAVVYEAFNDAIADFDVFVVAEAEGGNSVDIAAEATKKMLTDHPDITAFYATGGDNAAGIAKALKSMERSDIVVVGLEDTETNLNYLREGYIDLLVAQNPYQMGYQSVKAMLRYINDDHNLSDAISTSTITITQENIDSYK